MSKSRSRLVESTKKAPGLDEIYHENTKLHRHQWWTTKGESHRSGPRWRDFDRRMTRLTAHLAGTAKAYVSGEPFALPDVSEITTPPLFEAIRQRRSSRGFSGEPISLEDLTALLHFSYGITHRMPVEHGEGMALRAVPSGGALYPLEIYPLVNGVEGLPEGLFHYRPDANIVEHLEARDSSTELFRSTGEAFLAEAAVVFVVTGIFARHSSKYGERGYRLTLLDCGCMLENLSLVTSALGLGGCIIGGFIDDAVNDIVGVDGTTESTLALYATGVEAPNVGAPNVERDSP
jgi:SagB-type dehydrogenase family enzyme